MSLTFINMYGIECLNVSGKLRRDRISDGVFSLLPLQFTEDLTATDLVLP